MLKKEEKLNAMIARLIASTSDEESMEIYKDWAASYDEDLDYFGYVAPRIGATLLAEAIPERDRISCQVLDAGCGTGLVGRELQALGFAAIDGTDYSDAMLAQAAGTGHYQRLFQSNFSTRLNHIPDRAYGAVICIGVYSSNFKTHLISEMARVLAPGGLISVSCRPHYFEDEFYPQIKRHQAAGLLRIETVKEMPYMQGQDASAFYVLMQAA